ncbi:MAG: response regulator [Deltaproteobacteria bacterium]|nr:response regulator [Deltaproteobacteria bacterium]MDQ3295639.1 response regulator [Myxococcota bacterium]
MPSAFIIDPDITSNKLATILLQADGWRVVSMTTAKNALTALAALDLDLIVTELVFDDSDGLELIAQLRATQATRHIPIMVVTAANEPGTEYRARAAGCIHYLRKPIDVATFASELTAALRSHP